MIKRQAGAFPAFSRGPSSGNHFAFFQNYCGQTRSAHARRPSRVPLTQGVGTNQKTQFALRFVPGPKRRPCFGYGRYGSPSLQGPEATHA